jgi:hypothetical protein
MLLRTSCVNDAGVSATIASPQPLQETGDRVGRTPKGNSIYVANVNAQFQSARRHANGSLGLTESFLHPFTVIPMK